MNYDRCKLRAPLEAILSGASDYWTSVINAGRECSLEAIRAAVPEPLENAGQAAHAYSGCRRGLSRM